jgi:hypothetical protein
MDTQSQPQLDNGMSARQQLSRRNRNRALTGIALILIGIVLLVGTLLQSAITGYLILITVGVIFIAWSIAARQAGLMVPGGIITGVGVGILLINQAFPNAGGAVSLGILLLCLGGGFTIITLLTAAFTPPAQLWALVPGISLLVVGLLITVGTITPEMLNYLWPVVVIAVGVYVLWRAIRRGPSGPPESA